MKIKPAPAYCTLRKYLRYDKKTGLFYHKIGSSRRQKGYVAGFIRKDGYWSIGLNKQSYLGHKLAWYYVHGRWAEELDHENRIRSDNWIGNLRESTRQQNTGNHEGWGNKKSGLPRGVYHHPADKTRFRAQIYINYKAKHLGCFNTVDEAVAAYKVAALKHFGEFAP